MVLGDEEQIIEAWLNSIVQKTPQKLVLIVDSTIAWKPLKDDPLKIGDLPSETMFKAFRFGGHPVLVDRATIENFKRGNQKSQHFPHQITFSVPHKFLTENDLASVFKEKDGWQEFKRNYPNSDGYFSFSRIGFNQDNTEALLYAEQRAGWLRGEGRYVLFRKVDGIWRYAAEHGTWAA